jgi:hypothetical protein
MLQWHTNDQLNVQHQHDLLREAENQRLAQASKAVRSNSLYAPLMAGLGRQLSSLGHRLQEAYETPTGLPTKAPAK